MTNIADIFITIGHKTWHTCKEIDIQPNSRKYQRFPACLINYGLIIKKRSSVLLQGTIKPLRWFEPSICNGKSTEGSEIYGSFSYIADCSRNPPFPFIILKAWTFLTPSETPLLHIKSLILFVLILIGWESCIIYP